MPDSTEGIAAGQTTALMQDMVNDHAPDTTYSGYQESDQG
jgi:hypothetical protein